MPKRALLLGTSPRALNRPAIHLRRTGRLRSFVRLRGNLSANDVLLRSPHHHFTLPTSTGPWRFSPPEVRRGCRRLSRRRRGRQAEQLDSLSGLRSTLHSP